MPIGPRPTIANLCIPGFQSVALGSIRNPPHGILNPMDPDRMGSLLPPPPNGCLVCYVDP
jgi:hypothetical protein